MSGPVYDANGFRRIRPSERHPGMVELRLADGRCVQATGLGKDVERAVAAHARKLPARNLSENGND